jgi:hypothetical protein
MLRRRLKEPFGKAGLTVAMLALVVAMAGGAYAATGGGNGKAATASKAKSKKSKNKNSNAGLSGKQKKEVKKIAKQEVETFAGKPDVADSCGRSGSGC